MKEEVDAAAAFLSRIFLAHDNVAKEKVQEFTSQLSGVLQERFRDHWHEGCPTKGQAYRCIRVCPEEHLDPLLQRVCNQVGINVDDFNIPMELTLWVDPKEVVCKFGDLKCSYHTVAKKDKTSGVLDNQTEQLDIKDLVDNARDLYLKKQTVVIHPINSSEMHIQNPYGDGGPNAFTMAVRINGSNMSCSPPSSSTSGFDGSPRSNKSKLAHSSSPGAHHKRGAGFHYYGKATGGKGGFLANGHAAPVSSANHHNGNGGGFHRSSGGGSSSHHHHQHQHQQHHQHHHHNGHHHHHHQPQHHSSGPPATSSYQNGYLSSYQEEAGGFSVGYDHQRSVSPTKMNGQANGGGALPPSLTGLSQGSPTPEQIQQQMQHPPPIPPPPMPLHLQSYPPPHPGSDPSSSSLPPPPLPPPQSLPNGPASAPPPSSSSNPSSSANNNNTAVSSSISSSSSNTNNSNNNNNNTSGGKMNNTSQSNSGSSKFQNPRMGGGRGNSGRQSSPVKEVK